MPFYTGLTHDLFIDQAIHFQARPQNLSQTMQWIYIMREELYFSQMLHIELLLTLAGMVKQKDYHLNLVHNPSWKMEKSHGDFSMEAFVFVCRFLFVYLFAFLFLFSFECLFCFRFFSVLADIDHTAITKVKLKCHNFSNTETHWC